MAKPDTRLDFAEPAGLDAAGRGRAVPAAVWVGLGFIFGAVFWHFVGFWGFVADVVLYGRAGDQSLAVVRKNDVQATAKQTANPLISAIPAGPCVKLVIGRAGAPTRTAACDPADRLLPHTGAAKRGDFSAPDTVSGLDVPARPQLARSE